MKKTVKIVLITVLLTLPALGTYVKTTLPKLGFATDRAIERNTDGFESGKCQAGRMDASLYCNNKENLSVFANPITGGVPDFSRDVLGDFPVNFLLNAIPFDEELSVQRDVVEKQYRNYLNAPML